MLKHPVPRPYGTFVGRQWRTAFCLAVMGLLDGKTLKGEDAYILLRNGNVIRGNVEKSNGVAIIERGGNRRLKLDAIEVMGQGSSLRDLFVLRMRQRDRFDVSGLLEDARWGLRNGLLDEMEQPLKMVEMLDPTHPQLLLLRRQLEIAKRTPSVVADKTAPDKSAPERGAPRAAETPAAPGNNVRLATAIERTPAASAGLGGPIAVDREEEAIDAELAQAGAPEGAVAHFSRHVQSLLISRCGNAGCHRSPTEAEWQLQHRGSHVRPPGRMTKTNLATTLRWIDRSRTGESELLKHAIRPHGGRDVAAIRNSDDPALDALKRWIESVVLWETQVSSGEAVPLTKLKPIPSDAVAVPIEGGEFLPKDLTDGLDGAFGGGAFGAGAFAAGAFAVEPNAVRRASHMIEAAKEIEKLKLRHGSWSEASDRAAEGSLDPLTPIDDRPWGEFEPSDQGAVISGRVKRLPATKALSPGSGLGGGSEALPKRRNPGVGETPAESTPFTGEPITPFIPQRAMPNQALPQQAMPQQARGLIVSPFSPD
jgi:hypothetical protein